MSEQSSCTPAPASRTKTQLILLFFFFFASVSSGLGSALRNLGDARLSNLSAASPSGLSEGCRLSSLYCQHGGPLERSVCTAVQQTVGVSAGQMSHKCNHNTLAWHASKCKVRSRRQGHRLCLHEGRCCERACQFLKQLT